MSSNNITVKDNERSWAITLISDINGYLKDKGLYIKTADGEKTINTGDKRMFPDIILYGDKHKSKILQGWELKMPDVSITDRVFLEDAERKARNLGLNSFVVWNFSHAVLYLKNDNNTFEKKNSWDNSEKIKTREDVRTNLDLWDNTWKEIIIEVNSLLQGRVLRAASLGDIVAENVMENIIQRNKGILSEFIKTESLKDGTMRSYLDNWWIEAKTEYLSDESSVYTAYAKTLLLSWINKFLFSNIIKLYHNDASQVESINYDMSPEEANDIFKEITTNCDFYNIFNEMKYSSVIPNDTWSDLIEFNDFIKYSTIIDVDSKALQNILENTVAASKRYVIGQYTTPNKLANILVKLTISDMLGSLIDPCCGTGTITKASMKERNKHLSVNHVVETTWASDKMSFPLQIANLNMTNPEAINIPSRVFQSNVFDLKTNQIVEIVNPTDGEKMEVHLPKFSTIVSNLPFISSNSKKDEKESILKSIIKDIKETTGIALSKRADMYTYIVIKLKELLDTKGRLGIITSNAWLGSDVGMQFFEILHWYYNVKGIYTEGKGRWFKNAQVKATILILENKECGEASEDISISLGLFKKELKDLEDKDVDNLVISSNLQTELKNDVFNLNIYSKKTIDNLINMNVSINSMFHNIEWLLEIQNKLEGMSNLFDVFRGVKSGRDEYFYISEKDLKVGQKIEDLVDEEFIVRGLKNSRSLTKLHSSADTYVVHCNKTLKELENEGYSKTFNWFNNFKDNLNASLSVRGEKWNNITTEKLPILFTGMNANKRLFVGRFEEPTFINQRLIGMIPLKDDLSIDLCHALLNSIISMFYIEAIGFGRGLGAIDFSKDTYAMSKMLNPKLLSVQQSESILLSFDKIKDRNILDTLDELQDIDREKFDRTVLRAFEIEEYYEKIKESLLSMQTTRLSVK